MKTLRLFLFGFLVATSANAQVSPGSSCQTAGCSTTGSYQNLTGVSSMGSYSCLGSTPNPNWLAIGIAQNGNIHLQLQQSTGGGSLIDVDFALYGPYTSVSAGCPINGSTPTVDCSYSASATEQIDISNAQVGQVYILLITNYNGSSGTISITQNPSQPSSGVINCNINFAATTTQTPATCGQPNGSATVTANGGYPPYTYTWNLPGNPTTQTVNNLPPGTYTVTVTSSPNPTTGAPVNPTTATVTVQNINASFTATSTNASCPNGHDGTAMAHFSMNGGGGTGLTATYQWDDASSQTTQTATGLVPGVYHCAVTLSNGCTGTATVTVNSNSVTYSATSTLVSCPGGSDGTATATMSPVVGTLSYLWSDATGQTTPTATGLSAGTYTCTITSDIGCTGVATVAVTEVPGMTGQIIDLENPTCNSLNNGIMEVSVTNGSTPYSYSWDSSSSTTATASDLYDGAHTVTITDGQGCHISLTGTVTQPAALQIAQLTPNSMICSEDSITLTVEGAGGNGSANSNYTFTWSENGTAIGTGSSITVNPENDNTQYCVTLSEVCGSPTTDSCLMITFPQPIQPIFAAIQTGLTTCSPAEFLMDNQSVNQEEISFVYLSYGDGQADTISGSTDTLHTYVIPQTYDASAIVTSIYGCIYTADFPAIATVNPNPVADFAFSTNPTTVFETTVVAQDASSGVINKWDWTATDGTPGISHIASPTLSFPEGVVARYPVVLKVTDVNGCTDTVTKELVVNSDLIFYAPNAFTPDGDEYNQTWKIYVDGIDVYNFNLLIFDRWGEIVWETNDPSAEWDGTYNGKILAEGSYVWVAKVKDMYSDNKKTFNGAVSIIR